MGSFCTILRVLTAAACVGMDLHDACENGNIHLVVTLLEQGQATLAARDERGNTPLHNACLGAQIDLVKLFLGKKIDYSYISDGDQGNAVAVEIRTQGDDPDEEANKEYGRTCVEGYALPKGLTVNIAALKSAGKLYRDDYGSTPLNTLCALGSTTESDTKIARLLLEAGDPVNVSKTSDKMSPVSWSAYHGDLELLQVLLDPCIGPRANPIWASAPHNVFPIDLAGLRAVANFYGGVGPMTATRHQNHDRDMAGGGNGNGLDLTSGQLGQGQDPAACCQHLVAYGVKWLGHECKFAEAGGGVTLHPAALLRYRTHLLYWASCFGMTKEVRKLMASREDGLNFLAQRIAGTPDVNIRNRADSMDSVDDGGGGLPIDEEKGMRKRAEFNVSLPNSRESIHLIRGSAATAMTGKTAAATRATPPIVPRGSPTSLAAAAAAWKPAEIGSHAGPLGYSEFYVGGAIFAPVDGDQDADTMRADGGGGAVLTALDERTPAHYDGNLVPGQRLVAINGVDCSGMTFREIASLALKAMVCAMDDESMAAAARAGVPRDRVRIRMRDPDLYATARWRTAHWLDVESGIQRARDELDTLSPLARCAPLVKWQSPLHVACEHGMHECVEEMIRSMKREDEYEDETEDRVPLSAREGWFNSDENTPLHLAAAGNHVKCVKLLLKATPPIEIGFLNTAGWSEYGLAMKKCQYHIKRMRRRAVRDFLGADSGWEFVAVFDAKYIRELKNVIEGLTNESEETPGVQLRCDVWQWGPPGRVAAAQAAARQDQMRALQGMEQFMTQTNTSGGVAGKKKSGGGCCAAIQRLLTCACCPTCCPSVANDRTKKLYLLIKCTRPSYAAWAEHMGLKQSRRTSVLREEFRKDMQSQFEPFRSLEKQQILFDIIRRKFDVVKYKKKGTILSFFGLHHARGRDRVVETWDPWLKKRSTMPRRRRPVRGASVVQRRRQTVRNSSNTKECCCGGGNGLGGWCCERDARKDAVTDSDTDADTDSDVDSSDEESGAGTPRTPRSLCGGDTSISARSEDDSPEDAEKADLRLSREIKKRESRLRRARRWNLKIHRHYKRRMSTCAYCTHGWMRRWAQLPHVDCCRFCASLEGRDYPELTSLRNYFGQKMAGYFAWFEYHTHALALLAGAGVLAELVIQSMLYVSAYNARVSNTGVGTSMARNATLGDVLALNGGLNASAASRVHFTTMETTSAEGAPPTNLNAGADEKLADAFIEWLGISDSSQTTPWLYVLNDYTLLVWAIVVCVWTTLASEGWKRLLSQLYCIWGVEDGDADRYVRPEFIGDTRVPIDPSSFADGRTQLIGDKRVRYVMYILQVPVMGTMIAIVIVAWWYVNFVKESGMFLPLACRADYIDPITGWDWRVAAAAAVNSSSGGGSSSSSSSSSSTADMPTYAIPPESYDPVYVHEITTCTGDSCAGLFDAAVGNGTFIVANVSRLVPYCCGPASDACAAARANFFDPENLKGSSVTAGYSVVITLTNFLWGEMALLFTQWENHAHDSDFEVSLGLKSFAFQFLNSYMSLFWYAFVALDHDMLRAQLANLMIFKQLSDYVLYLVLPFLTYRLSLWRRGLPFRRLFAHYSVGSDEEASGNDHSKKSDFESMGMKPSHRRHRRSPTSAMTDAQLAARYHAAQQHVEDELCRCLKEYYAQHNPVREFEVKEKVRKYLRKGGVANVESLFKKIEEKYGEPMPERSYSTATVKIAEGPAPFGTKSTGSWGSASSLAGPASMMGRGGGKKNKVHAEEEVDTAKMFRCPAEKNPLLEQIGMQESMHKQPSVITFYVRAIVQFGYVSMFGKYSACSSRARVVWGIFFSLSSSCLIVFYGTSVW